MAPSWNLVRFSASESIHLVQSLHQIEYVLQSEMMAATEKLHPLLEKRPKGTSWRLDPGYFPSGLEGLQGLVDFSPAWFQQAHEVSCLTT